MLQTLSYCVFERFHGFFPLGYHSDCLERSSFQILVLLSGRHSAIIDISLFLWIEAVFQDNVEMVQGSAKLNLYLRAFFVGFSKGTPSISLVSEIKVDKFESLSVIFCD